MPKIHTCLSNALINGVPDLGSKTIVVIDILRATTCIVYAFELGVSEMKAFADESDCRRMKDEGYLIAGERNGKKLDGFDLGNSPFDYKNYGVGNRKVAITTTNGTRALEASKVSNKVLIGAFINYSSVFEFLKKQDQDILLYCSGWKDMPNTEDTLFAGKLAMELKSQSFSFADDSTEIASSLYQNRGKDIKTVILESAHAKRLQKIGDISDDLEFASKLDLTDKIPIYSKGNIQL
jgi:2-phosphosulfolactate phosphatase